MQASQYSIYDEFYKEQLEYVYAHCGVSGWTDIPPPLSEDLPAEAPYCVTGKRYTTKAGDTCESIANSTSVSGAALCLGNQDILPSCLHINAGINVCLPLTCETLYVRPSDTCLTIEKALGLDSGKVRTYNTWINTACTNLQDRQSSTAKTPTSCRKEVPSQAPSPRRQGRRSRTSWTATRGTRPHRRRICPWRMARR